MAITGDVYHPGFKILYDKGLMYYSRQKKQYRLLKTGKKKHFISEQSAMRIVRYLYYPTGQRKPGRSIHDPLSKIYGLHKQRQQYATKGKIIKEITLTGKQRHIPKRVIREKKLVRRIKRYPKAPEIKQDELPKFKGAEPRTIMKYHVNRRQSKLYAASYKIRLTTADGSKPLDPRFIIHNPSEMNKSVEWIVKHIIEKNVLNIANIFRKKYGMTPSWQIGGVVGYTWVQKNQKKYEADENGKTCEVVKLHRKKFEYWVVQSFERALREAIEENIKGKGDEREKIFKTGERVLRMVWVTSFIVKCFTTTEKLTSRQKTFAKTVGIYPSEQPGASWKNH